MVLTDKLHSFRLFVRRVIHLSTPYFRSEEKWKARGLFAVIVALNLGSVYLAVLFNDWNGRFYNALQNKDAATFWAELLNFCYLAFFFIVVAVYRFYLTQLLEMNWRQWMTRYYMGRWLDGNAFYRMELARFTRQDGQTPDNPDQRISEDVNTFTTQTISLTMGLLNATVTLASFVGILWGLSGSFAFSAGGSSYTIPGFMVWVAVLYCLAGSVLTHYIGRSQIRLNFEQLRREADYRHHMMRVREYSESIALDRGQPVEKQHLTQRFQAVLANYLALIRAQKQLIWFTTFFGQAATVFPLVVAAPRFFSGAIQLGELIQISSAFGRVQDSLSWFVENYSTLAAWRATVDRLTSFDDAISTAGEANPDLAMTAGEGVAVQGLDVRLPTGVALLSGSTVRATAGDRILLQGPSGSGKSTFFRTLAGIWPYARGAVARSADTMFIPQRPYFPNGPLREALAYPEAATRYSDSAMQQALHDALLPALADQLDQSDAWGQKLSGGEQQRLAIARVLLKQPAWVFADEATSALDEAAEKTLYERLLAMVQRTGGGLVSIAHKPSVAAFHTARWELQEQPEGAPARFAIKPSAMAG
ncbi:MAG: ABC transporter ATP-binding protein/permease [Rhodoferax sp.]